MTDKLATHTTTIMNRFQSILSPQQNKDDTNSSTTFTIESQASEALQMENSAIAIIRMVEELLGISRALKEAWILHQVYVKENDQDNKDDVRSSLEGLQGKLELALKVILQQGELEGEVDSDEFNSDGEKEEEQEEGDKKKEEEEKQEGKQEEIIEDKNDTVKGEDIQVDEIEQEQKSTANAPQITTTTTTTQEDPTPQPTSSGQNPENSVNKNQEHTTFENINNFANPINLDDEVQDVGGMDDLDFDSFGGSGNADNGDDGNDDDIIMLD